MNKWHLENEFTAKTIMENIENKTFEVPQYQRGLAWTQKQKDDFVDSLKRGLPFGTILLYKNDNKYQIIDGLQRCTTIGDFIKEPAKYFNESDFTPNLPAELIKVSGYPETETLKNKINDYIQQWIHKLKAEDIHNIQYYEFANDFTNEFAYASDHKKIADTVKEPFKRYKDLCDEIYNMHIPAIVITGEVDVLPEIFERINSNGTQLSKYEIYAATASCSDKYKINSPKLSKLIDYNKQRYDAIQTTTLQIADYDSIDFGKDKELNVFEICYGFGKYLNELYPGLFNGGRDIVNVESCGFTLINSCLCQKNSNSKKLMSIFNKYVDNNNIEKFLIAILDCVKLANNIVKKYNVFKLNSKDIAGPLHSEYQIISIIANIFINRHVDYNKDSNDVINFKLLLDVPKKGFSSYYEKLKDNLCKRYCIDIINQKWAGSGDKRMNNVIFDENYYTQPILWNDFNNNLQNWFKDESLNVAEYQKVASPREREKLFLSMIYLSVFKAGDALDSTQYDIEHLATKNLIKQCLDRYSEGEQLRLPISSIANLCLLPMQQNRSKRDKTIYDDDKYLKNAGMSLSDIERKFTFTEKKDLIWLNDDELTREDFKSKYYSYINKRFNKLLEIIKNSYDTI